MPTVFISLLDYGPARGDYGVSSSCNFLMLHFQAFLFTSYSHALLLSLVPLNVLPLS